MVILWEQETSQLLQMSKMYGLMKAIFTDMVIMVII